MFGFLKVIKGKIRISSYSFLDFATKEFIYKNYANYLYKLSDSLEVEKRIPVKFEG